MAVRECVRNGRSSVARLRRKRAGSPRRQRRVAAADVIQARFAANSARPIHSSSAHPVGGEQAHTTAKPQAASPSAPGRPASTAASARRASGGGVTRGADSFCCGMASGSRGGTRSSARRTGASRMPPLRGDRRASCARFGIGQHSRTLHAVPANPVRQSGCPACVSSQVRACAITVPHVADRSM